MGRIIPVTVYWKDSAPITNPYTSACVQAFQADDVILVATATTAQKMSVPAASGSINTAITMNYDSNNAGERHVWYVGDSITYIAGAS